MLKYSIIVPVYNAEKYLNICVDSILANQNQSDYEIILVDDGSKDSSGSICDAYAQKNPWIKVIHNQNGGASNARNTGLLAAQGQYILFVDADDVVDVAWIEEIDNLVEQHPDMAEYGAQSFGCEQENFLLPAVIGKGETGKEYLKKYFEEIKTPRWFVWSLVFSREFLFKNRIQFDETLPCSEDFDFILNSFSAANSIVGTDKVLYYYRVVPTSLSRTVSHQKIMANLISKAKWFRRYPESSFANTFMSNVLLLSSLKEKEEILEAERFIFENKDILNFVSLRRFRLAGRLMHWFGIARGVRVYNDLTTLFKRIIRRQNV